jgi:hypothetical protein
LLVVATIIPVASDTIDQSVQPIDSTIGSQNGTEIDRKLSEYYGIPVANGPNGTSWYVEQSWHSSEEIIDLSTDNQMHGDHASDYAEFSTSRVPMPLNLLLIVAFIGIAYYISKRYL